MITSLPIHIVLSFFPTTLISILMTTNKIYITQEGNLFLVKRHQDCSLSYLERKNQWIRLSSHHSLVDKLLPPLFTVAPTKTSIFTHLDNSIITSFSVAINAVASIVVNYGVTAQTWYSFANQGNRT